MRSPEENAARINAASAGRKCYAARLGEIKDDIRWQRFERAGIVRHSNKIDGRAAADQRIPLEYAAPANGQVQGVGGLQINAHAELSPGVRNPVRIDRNIVPGGDLNLRGAQ